MTKKYKKPNIKHYNDKGEQDDYWEKYWLSGNLWFKEYYNDNGKRIGCWHWYDENNKLYKIAYYI